MRHITNDLDYHGPGVYALCDNDNGKLYIGSSTDIATRLYQHDRSFQNERCNRKLLKAVKNNHTFTSIILEKLPEDITFYDLRGAESKWIKRFDTTEKGYNKNWVYSDEKSDWCSYFRYLGEDDEMADYIFERITKAKQKINHSEPTDREQELIDNKCANQMLERDLNFSTTRKLLKFFGCELVVRRNGQIYEIVD